MPESNYSLADYDRYIAKLFAPEDDALRQAIADTRSANLPEIFVSASEGKILYVLAKLIQAKRILELGTLGGYSTIWLARALPDDGKLLSLEIDPKHAEVSRRNINRAGLQQKVEVRLGPAAESLKNLQASKQSLFDLIFIDADKENYPLYLELVLPLARSGGIILADNTLSHDAPDPHADTGISRYNALVAKHPNLISIILPVLRTKGIDGLLISVKK